MPRRIIVLTDERIAKAKPGPRRYAIYDPAAPGLAIRVQPSGHKTFVYGAKYPRTGHFTRVELGQAGRLTLAEARAKARRWGELIGQGIDPRDDEAKARLAAAQAVNNSFAAVAEAFIARHLKGKRKAAVVAREIRTELVKHWAERPITEITRRDVVELIEAIVDRPAPTYAHNIFGHVRTLFNWAINRDIYGLQASPCDRLKPAQLIGAKKARERVLTDSELRVLWSAAATLGYPFGPAVRMLMLTGARLTEVTGARWREFDLQAQLWTIPAEQFKMEAQHFIPLTDEVLTLLSALPRWTRGDHLFSTTEGRKPVAFSSRAKRKLDAAINTDPWTLHDIRRTVRTRLSALRVPDLIAEMVIGHARKGMGRVYDQHKYLEEMREALTAWAGLLRNIIEPLPPNVVPLETRTSR